MVKLIKPACQAGERKRAGKCKQSKLVGEGNVFLGNEVKLLMEGGEKERWEEEPCTK